MRDAINQHLKEQIRTLTDEEWYTVETIALALVHQNPNMHLIMAEANALVAMLNEKDLGLHSRLVH